MEIAASSASYDLQEKLQVYRRNGVQEYIVWQVSDRLLDWFRLRDGEYFKLTPDTDNIIKSEVFPGLWLAIALLLKSDLAQVLHTVQRGLDTSEHQNFVRKISKD